jgi:2-methylisocitrate lyase-like PEP mutase family enzyme
MIIQSRNIFLSFLFLKIVVGLPFIKAAGLEEVSMARYSHSQLQEKARLLHSLHHEGSLLFLPNAWDALSAKIFEQAGAKAIATTSAGIAAVFGYADGEQLPKDLLFTMVDRIVKSVTVPVTVDLEAGFGDTPEEICETVLGILRRGAVGINIEDADPRKPGQLFSIAEQTEKIRAIRALARKENIPLFINARTDVFWLKLLTTEERLPEALIRLKAYREAGADGVFVPGLTDPDSIVDVVKKIAVPLNLLAGPWIPDLNTLKPLGVARVTLGSSGARDCAGHMKTFVQQYLAGQYTLNPTISYDEFNALFNGEQR